MKLFIFLRMFRVKREVIVAKDHKSCTMRLRHIILAEHHADIRSVQHFRLFEVAVDLLRVNPLAYLKIPLNKFCTVIFILSLKCYHMFAFFARHHFVKVVVVVIIV